MAKKSAVERDTKRRRMSKSQTGKRNRLKAIIYNKDTSLEDRFQAQLTLAALPRNGSKTRIRNRCELSGRPRGFYRKFRLSRVALRDFASIGQIPGVIKSSW